MFLSAAKLSEHASAVDTTRCTTNSDVYAACSSNTYNKVHQLTWWGRPFAMENAVFRSTLFSPETD